MPDRVLMEYTDKKTGEKQNLWVLTSEVKKAQAGNENGSAVIVPKARVRVRSPWNTQVVREFSGYDVPENIQRMVERGENRSGWTADLLGASDSLETTTPKFAEGANVARYHVGQAIKMLPAWLSSRLPGGGGVLGLLGRGSAQFGAEVLGDVAGRAVAQEKQDPASSVVTGGVSALGNMAADVVSGVPNRIAAEVYGMSGVGNVKPGVKDPLMPEKLLAKQLPVTKETLAELDNAQQAHNAAARQLINQSTNTVSTKRFGDRLRSWLTIQKRSNLLSKQGQAAVQTMQKVLHERVGGNTRVSPLVGPTGQPINVQVPWSDFSAVQIDEVRRIAHNEIRSLKSAQRAQRSRTAAAEEKAWEEIYDESLRALNDIDPEIGAIRRRERDIIDQRDAVSNALVQGKTGTLFNAAFRLLGGPSKMSKAAIVLSNPALPDRIRTVPALTESLIRLGYWVDQNGRIHAENPLRATYRKAGVSPDQGVPR